MTDRIHLYHCIWSCRDESTWGMQIWDICLMSPMEILSRTIDMWSGVKAWALSYRLCFPWQWSLAECTSTVEVLRSFMSLAVSHWLYRVSYFCHRGQFWWTTLIQMVFQLNYFEIAKGVIKEGENRLTLGSSNIHSLYRRIDWKEKY